MVFIDHIAVDPRPCLKDQAHIWTADGAYTPEGYRRALTVADLALPSCCYQTLKPQGFLDRRFKAEVYASTLRRPSSHE